MVAAWRLRVRSALEESRRAWVGIPVLFLAWFTWTILDDSDAAELWMVLTLWIVSLTLAGGLELSRRSDEGVAARRALDLCTVLALCPFLAAALVFAFAALVLPAERGFSFDLQSDAQVTWFVAVMVLPVVVPIVVASLVILRRRGSDLDLRIQAATWTLILLVGMVLAAFPGNINVGPGGPLLLFLVVVYGPVLRRILWPALHLAPLPVPTYRPV